MTISILMPFKPDWGQRDRLFDVVADFWTEILPDAELLLGTDDGPVFNRSAARNAAFLKSSGDILIIADADTLIPPDQIFEAVELVQSGVAPWCIPYTVYYNLLEEETEEILDNFSVEIPEPKRWEHRLTDSVAGILVLPAAAYATVKGYDENFQGWGGEDRAFDLAMDTLWGKKLRLPGFVEHLWHPRGDADFSQPSWGQNAQLLRSYQGAQVSPLLMRRLVESR